MKRLVHISDLHFGRTDPMVVAALADDIKAQRPDLVVVSGDLTMRAKPAQFAEARSFLEALPAPWMVVPGNHDLPVYNLFARFVDPLHHYRRHIGADLDPFRSFGDVAVLGLNTARSLIVDFSEGRVNARQMRRIEVCLGKLSADVFKVVFTHHPFLPPPDRPNEQLVGRATRTLRVLERAGVDLLLAGHLHRAYTGDIMTRHALVRRSILVVQASTATSTRLRDEPNAYNIIDIEEGRVALQVRGWEGARFTGANSALWCKRERFWEKQAEDTGLAKADGRLVGRARSLVGGGIEAGRQEY